MKVSLFELNYVKKTSVVWPQPANLLKLSQVICIYVAKYHKSQGTSRSFILLTVTVSSEYLMSFSAELVSSLLTFQHHGRHCHWWWKIHFRFLFRDCYYMFDHLSFSFASLAWSVIRWCYTDVQLMKSLSGQLCVTDKLKRFSHQKYTAQEEEVLTSIFLPFSLMLRRSAATQHGGYSSLHETVWVLSCL